MAATWIESTGRTTFRWVVVRNEGGTLRSPCFTLREAKQVAEEHYHASGKWERMVDLSGKVIYQDTKGLQ